MFESSASVKLVGGGRAVINFGSISYPEQIYVRLGDEMVVGITSEPEPAIYLWKENLGVYYYFGDINLRKLDDDLIALHIHAPLSNNPGSEKETTAFPDEKEAGMFET